ncbi:MAG: hypothetical protein IKS20_03835, partial [Victivallales bacterium]|nr:hypothetical protein [Victivallales bacterium]
AHKRGIKVIDHHSSCLVWHPDTPKRREAAYYNLRAWKMDPKNYEGLFDYLLDPNFYLMPRVQRDGEGEPIITPYNGFAHCYNNPDYRREYLQYLESVYATGVDGIMTDDVQYWGQSCNCPSCRKKFAEKYGFELPGPGQWGKFFKRLDAPGAVEQLRFRAESTHEFHVLVKEHYEKLGLKMLRPNYSAAMLARDWTSISLENLPALDWFFIECCNGSIPRYAWPAWLMEHSQRVMQANERNIPPMLCTYHKTLSNLMVSFSMARLTGSLYTNTVIGEAGPDETLLRNFEKRYAQWCFHTRPMQDIGVYYSKDSKDYGIGYEAGRFLSWLQCLVVSNIPFRLIDADSQEIPEECPVLMLIDVRMMADVEVKKLRNAAALGKTVIIAGICGDERPDGTFRTEEEYRQLWGWNQKDIPEQGFREYPLGKGKLVAVGELYGRPGDPEKWRKILADKYWLFSAEEPAYTYDAVILGNSPKEGQTAEYKGRYLELKPAFAQLVRLLGQFNDNPSFKTEGLPELVLTHAAERAGEGLVIHMANFAGTIDLPAGTLVRKDDQMPWPAHKGMARLMARRRLSSAKVIFVNGEGPALNVEYQPETGYSTIAFPLELLHDYAMILAKP